MAEDTLLVGIHPCCFLALSQPPPAEGEPLFSANEGEYSLPASPPYADNMKADGTCHRLSCYPVFPNAACPRRLCQPPWTQPSLSETCPLSGGTNSEKSSHPKRQPLFGREGSGGRGASLREAASPPSVPHPTSLRKGVRGRGLLYREASSPGNFILTFRLLPLLLAFGNGR